MLKHSHDRKPLKNLMQELPEQKDCALQVPIKRNTVQKNLILKALHELNHPSAENIYTYVSTNFPALSRATVYRNLKTMSEEGEISLIEIPSGPDHFDHTSYPHYHFQCKKCSGIFDVDLPYQTNLNTIKSASGFKIDNHMLLFTGTCPKCQN